MTDIAKKIFECHQVRKNNKQKAAFFETVKDYSSSLGYECKKEKGSLGAKNIIVGDPDSAKVIYTAHYDTCPVLPFPNFITPKNIGIYLLYQLVVLIFMFALFFVGGFIGGALLGLAESLIPGEGNLSFLVPFVTPAVWVTVFWLLFAGPANKHTANDNTSGVVTLCSIMASIPESDRDKVAFVFFDLEETGLWGSAGFASKHKSIQKNTLLVNFDCVSDGDNILLVLSKGAKSHRELLESSFIPSDACSVELADKGVFYPSDQANFKRGVGVASLKRTKRGMLYMDRIHTNRDTVWREENIEFLTACATELARRI